MDGKQHLSSDTAQRISPNSKHMDFLGNKLYLAPLAGITDTVFRRICKENGADVVMSEMVSAEGLFYKSKLTERLLRFDNCERPVGIQLFGAKPDHMAYAADFVQKKYQPDFIDLNSGCPAPKVVKKNGGASLLKDIQLFRSLVSAIVKSVPVPVSVKIRSGWFEHEWVDVEFAQAAEECGASAIILHPRSKTMAFSGHSYWDRISVVKKAVTIPVIGNGDVQSPQDALDMFSQTGCDGVMIGRAALGNPWLFSQIKQLQDTGSFVVPTAHDRIKTACEHIHTFTILNGEKKAVADLKKHASWYIKGIDGASGLRTRIFTAHNTAEILDALEDASEAQE